MEIVHPTIIKLSLFQHSYKDRKILASIKRRLRIIYLNKIKTRFYLRRQDLEKVLNEDFQRDLQEFEQYDDEELRKNITSVYFISKILKENPKLKYFEIDIINTEQYSRVGPKGNIWFEYTIVHSKVDLTQNFISQEMRDLFSKTISEFNIGDSEDSVAFKKPYVNANAQEVLQAIIESISDKDPEEEDFEGYTELSNIFNNKLYVDNSELLIVFEK